MNILSLDDYALEAILEKLSYSEIAKLRQVCKRFNYLCKNLLNRGCTMLIKRNKQEFICEAPIINPTIGELYRKFVMEMGIENGILMDSVFRQYIEVGFSEFQDPFIFCFIPGKVLDEFHRIGRLLNSLPKNPSEMEFCNLIDHRMVIDQMKRFKSLMQLAMKHFISHVIPMVKRKKRTRALKKILMCRWSERDLLPQSTLESHPYIAWKLSLK